MSKKTKTVDGHLLQNYFFSANRPPTTSVPNYEQVEVLAKEFAQQISGLSEHTVRHLVLQNKLPHIRTGQGKRGKILVPKSALLEYLRSAA